MNHKHISAVAAFLILGVLLSATPLAYAATVLTFGPKLEVVTIAQDNQVLEKGIILLGIVPGAATDEENDLLSQHKIIVTYNGATLMWRVGDPGPTVACNVLEKDKIAVQADPKTGDGKQGDWENLMTTLVDVSDKFVCKVRWKHPFSDESLFESVGVLDVYYLGPLPDPLAGTTGHPTVAADNKAVGVWIADNILVVEAFFTVGRTVVLGSDIQDICVLGWAPGDTYRTATTPTEAIFKPDHTDHFIWANAMGDFVSCEELALGERSVLGIEIPAGQDPLA